MKLKHVANGEYVNLDSKLVIDRNVYKGRGRPRLATDYTRTMKNKFVGKDMKVVKKQKNATDPLQKVAFSFSVFILVLAIIAVIA